MSQPTAQLKPYESLLPHQRLEFRTTDGTALRGNFYLGKSSASSSAAVIFCHGLGLVKEQYLENWIRYFIAAGYHVFSYDHRTFGVSEGVPRENFDWVGQAEDFIDAVTFVRQIPVVKQERVFAWGVAHAGGVIAMAAAMDKRIAGIIMFLPRIDGAYDESLWAKWVSESARRDRVEQSLTTSKVVKFWPLTDDEAAGKGGSVLSGDYVREWSECARKMAEQGNNTFTGNLTLRSFWSDFNTRPLDYFRRIAPTPLLWIMATNDIVCGPLDWTKSEYEKLSGPKEILVLEGEHLLQYFDPGFPKSVEAMLAFMNKYAK